MENNHGFYDLPKGERVKLVEEMKKAIRKDLQSGDNKNILKSLPMILT